ncbi:hypothetical protein AD006_31035 (plasmid) [Pseudonocardia sp. EC080610-09]|uniref:universal stress protein n=1 Tax=unclassified Pseudonocardia TaxID=2619320 RepID=UPI000705F635|nr:MULTISPECIES: universal stress protein [unclassified Pseudonocardia]ALL79869.1 hypothetical protein AD006_31035 [Pseudonocardia sp. EC080610-09]ALL85752.1 hypothetical protein AD017_30195 [Pseudonocardia sp. EC080619-01]
MDGTPGDRYALSWAVRAARAHGLVLRVVHATPRLLDQAALDQARRAAELARELDPGVPTRIVIGAAAIDELLVEESATARMLVLGPHPGRPLEGFSFTHSTTVAAAARCPVVAVPRLPGRLPGDHGPVVVGVDGRDRSAIGDAALGFAFHHASCIGAELVAVHARPDEPADPSSHTGERAGSGAGTGEHALARRLAGYERRHPDVCVTRLVAHTRAVDALLEWAETAQLLVVGSSGRAGLHGLLHGSISQALLYRSPCALAVIGVRAAAGMSAGMTP